MVVQYLPCTKVVRLRGLGNKMSTIICLPIHIFVVKSFTKKSNFSNLYKVEIDLSVLIWITGLEWLISYALYIKWNFWIIFSNCTSNKTTSVCSLVCTGLGEIPWKEMATHLVFFLKNPIDDRILAGIKSMRWQRDGYDWATKHKQQQDSCHWKRLLSWCWQKNRWFC